MKENMIDILTSSGTALVKGISGGMGLRKTEKEGVMKVERCKKCSKKGKKGKK